MHMSALSLQLMAAVRLGQGPAAEPVQEAFFLLKNLMAVRVKTRAGDVAWRVVPPKQKLLEIIRGLGLPKPPARVTRKS